MEGKGGGAAWRTSVIAKHLVQELSSEAFLQRSDCLSYAPPESNSGNIPPLSKFVAGFMSLTAIKSTVIS